MLPIRIILTGFMGTGKTAVGLALSKSLGYEFLDTDLMVEQETTKSITKIFEEEGEEAFRGYEKKMVQKSLQKERVVIATGGGAVTDPESLQLIKERGFLIGLSASPEAIMARIAQMQTRPLIHTKENTKDKMKRIKELLSHRSPYYREADQIIDTTNKSVEATVEEILNVLHGEPDR